MNTRVIIGIVVVAALVLAGYFFWPKAKEPTQDTTAPNAPVAQEEETYSVRHSFDDGVHTISGVITLPTPCHELRENIRIAESFPEQVFIDLTTVDTGGICIQVIDEREFSIDVEVDEAASFALTINGAAVSLPSIIVE